MTEISDSQIEAQELEGGSGEEGKMAPHLTSVRETGQEREVRGESGEEEEEGKDRETEGREEDGMTGGAPVMRTG